MNINFIDKSGLLVAVIDDFYPESVLVNMEKELASVCTPEAFGMFSNSGVSISPDNNNKQKSKSLFLDEVFEGGREASVVLRENRLLFSAELGKQLEKRNAFFGHIRKCTQDFTLINVYAVGDYYREHTDGFPLTAITFLGGGVVEGGNLGFPEYNVSIPPQRNRVVVFPGCVSHTSEPVKRGVKISMAQFMSYQL